MVFVSAELSRGRGERRSPAPRVALRRRARQEVQYHVLVQAQTARGSSTSWGSARSQTTSWCFMASPDHDVSGRDGDVGPHRHLEGQTDHLLFSCQLSSPVAKHDSHAYWSLRSPCGFVALRQAFVRRCHSATEPRVSKISEAPRFKTLIYLKGFGVVACRVLVSTSKFVGADEQNLGRGQSD